MGKVPETKTLPCEAIFQKWHSITWLWEILELPWELGVGSTAWAKKPFCSLFTYEDTNNYNFSIIIFGLGFML
jgi:hypothetical protein